MLDWSQGTVRQRITVTDDSSTDTAVFSFQQSTDSGSNYTNLFVIKDNGTVTATKFIGALQGTADLALGLYTSGANSDIWSTTGITSGAIKYVHNINKNTTGLFNNINNANGILIINTHPNTDDTRRYHHELGFSSNNKLYHRAINDAVLNNT